MKILVAYATSEGHTRHIANRVAHWLRNRGYRLEVCDSARPQIIKPGEFDGFIVLGSVHFGRHQRILVRFVTANAKVRRESPSAFISVCGAEAQAGEEGKIEARGYIRKFNQETGWQPTLAIPIGGALLYTKYNFIIRAVMKSISQRSGLPTDTTRDYDLTDWAALESFVKPFAAEHLKSAPDPIAIGVG